MAHLAFYYYEDALNYARSIIEDIPGGFLIHGIVDCCACDCPRGLDNWSGETGAIYVYGNDCNELCVIGYHITIEDEQFLKEN